MLRGRGRVVSGEWEGVSGEGERVWGRDWWIEYRWGRISEELVRMFYLSPIPISGHVLHHLNKQYLAKQLLIFQRLSIQFRYLTLQ